MSAQGSIDVSASGRRQTSQDHLVVTFNPDGHHDPAVLSLFVIRDRWCRKERIREYAYRDGNQFFQAFDRIVNRRSADGAELEVCFVAFIAYPNIPGRLA